MKKVLLFFGFLLFLAGCSSELTFTEIKPDDAKKGVLTFFESVEDINGAHLYFDGDDVFYVLLNGKNVTQGEKAIHFVNFNVDSDDGNLNIYYIEEETENYSDETLKYQVIYKIEKDKDYEKIRLFKNGNEVPFEVASGN